MGGGGCFEYICIWGRDMLLMTNAGYIRLYILPNVIIGTVRIAFMCALVVD